MKHNSYFDGKVQSLEVRTIDGRATIGVITPGKFTFSTGAEEKIIITSGTLKAKLHGKDWQSFSTNQSFIAPGNSAFDVEAAADVSYICYYKD